jgi:hypothetical protein
MGRLRPMTVPVQPQLLHVSGAHHLHPPLVPGLVAPHANSSSPYGQPEAVYHQATYPAPIQTAADPMYLRECAFIFISTWYLLTRVARVQRHTVCLRRIMGWQILCSSSNTIPPTCLACRRQDTTSRSWEKRGSQCPSVIHSLSSSLNASAQWCRDLSANGLLAPGSGSEDGTPATFGSLPNKLSELSPTSLEHHDHAASDGQQQETSQQSHPENMLSLATP